MHSRDSRDFGRVQQFGVRVERPDTRFRTSRRDLDQHTYPGRPLGLLTKDIGR
jgi:hypothetical protein